MKHIGTGEWLVTLKGRTFYLTKHDAHNTSGKAWSAYEVINSLIQDEPTGNQTRTRYQMIAQLDALR